MNKDISLNSNINPHSRNNYPFIQKNTQKNIVVFYRILMKQGKNDFKIL